MNLQNYLSESVEAILKGAVRTTLKNPKESIYLLKFSRHARKANRIRQSHIQNIPAFLIASITGSCNLHCTGCYSWASNREESSQLSDTEWEDIFNQAGELGISFIVLAGGEPMMRKDVILKASNHPEILFPIFTNGTMIDDETLRLFDDNRNLVPVLSLEGDRHATDSRRGEGVYENLVDVMHSMREKNIIFGASLTFTKENISNLLSDEFIERLHDLGCKVVFFIEYVPMNGKTLGLAPGESERELLLEKIESLRNDYEDMLFMSFPGDEKESGGCLAAGRGFFHINPNGGAEPCPASPYSDINVRDASLLEVLDSKLFKSLREKGILTQEHEGGCVLFEHKEDVEKLVGQNNG